MLFKNLNSLHKISFSMGILICPRYLVQVVKDGMMHGRFLGRILIRNNTTIIK